MIWLVSFAKSSIGKKQFMAVTGLAFCGFLVVHLAGNLTMYGGAEWFNSYAEHLHALGPLLYVAEAGLIFFALVHVVTGATLFAANMAARPSRYASDKSEGGRTLSSSLMPYTGLLIAVFVTIHLLNFTFVDHAGLTVSDIVRDVLVEPAYIALYMVAMAIVGLHVRHGFWSAFQTFGANHPKYMPAVKAGSVLLALALAAGFGSLPVLVASGGLG